MRRRTAHHLDQITDSDELGECLSDLRRGQIA